jgi:hypothetical protein
MFSKIQRILLNRITLGKTITYPINGMITINEYISYRKYVTERHSVPYLFNLG